MKLKDADQFFLDRRYNYKEIEAIKSKSFHTGFFFGLSIGFIITMAVFYLQFS